MSPSDSLLGAVTVEKSSRRPDDFLRLPRTQYEAFAALTGWGLLLHLLAVEGERSLWLLLALAGAVAVSVRPASVLGLTAVLVAMAGRTLFDIDPPPGFWFFLAVLAPFWFGFLYSAVMRHRGWPLMAELGPRFAPVLRTAFVTGWLVVLAHQINDAFFNVATSCTVEIYGRSRDLLVFLPSLTPDRADWLPTAVIVIELVIVLGLWIVPLRRIPVVVALVFHLVVGAAEPGLGALAFGFLVLFIFGDIVDAGLDQLAAIGHRRPAIGSIVAVLGLTVIVLAVLKVVAAVVFGAELFGSSPFGLAPLVASVGTVATGLILLFAYSAGTFGPDPLTDAEEPAEWVGPTALLMATVVIGLGAAPYLGLGTAYALTDYSSLRTEEGRWNHRVLPEATDVFETQEPLLRVLRPADPGLARLGDGLPVPLSRVELVEGELSRRVVKECRSGGSGADVGPITVASHTSVTVVTDPCADPELNQSQGWLLDRALAYRVVPQGDFCLQ